ncbi:MAG: DNA mismatch repair protein MutL [Firmicutes bacterium]|nr:DNA mismatch repair protein MutL [candidate division NPL-UPA2 bacterium]
MGIKVLETAVVNQISAGEVVERPASAVKELVENSLDAGATDVTVEIERGGLTLIRVTDNGQGMNKDDLAVSVLRHATSKLTSITDLFSLKSLGFRGEALPSIAAVSQLSIKSRRRESGHGYLLVCQAGTRQDVQVAGMPVGTIVEVRQLFANTPARLKFMKSATAEGQRIAHCIERLALSHPSVRFTLLLEGRIVLQSSGNSLVDTAAAIYGAGAAKHLWAFSEVKGRHIALSGVLSRPPFTRGNRAWQFFFLNGRCIEHRGLGFALDEAYRTLIPTKRFAVAAVHITMDPAEVDVNVHPAKTEVRFRDERAVISEAITLLRAKVAAMNKPSASIPELPHLPLASAIVGDTPDALPPARVSYLPNVPYRLVGQIMNSYLLFEKDGKLVIVDQHAAHERIIFEELLHKRTLEVLNFAIPMTVDLGTAVVTEEHLATIASLGIVCEPFGGSTYVVRSIPAVYRGHFDEQTLRELLMDISGDKTQVDAEESVAEALACRAAIKAHTKLSPAEMVELLDRLHATDRAVACPHGRPVEIEYTAEELFRLFHPSSR